MRHNISFHSYQPTGKRTSPGYPPLGGVFPTMKALHKRFVELDLRLRRKTSDEFARSLLSVLGTRDEISGELILAVFVALQDSRFDRSGVQAAVDRYRRRVLPGPAKRSNSDPDSSLG